MSRSVKKFPFCKDVKSSKWGKKQCNKKIRKISNLPNGCAYKHIIEKWDYIYDYCGSMTWKEYKKWVECPRFWRTSNIVEQANYYDWYRIYKQK